MRGMVIMRKLQHGLAPPATKSIFSTPKAPPIPEPVPIADLGDQKVISASRKAKAAAQSRTGRRSTILTDNGAAKVTKLGG